MSSYIEHQQSVLGAIFLEPSCLDKVSQIVKLHDFDELHGQLYKACVDIKEDGGLPDFVTVSKLNLCDPEYLVKLIDFVPTSANVGFYAKGVSDYGQRRRVGSILTEAMAKLKGGDNPTAWIEEQLSNLRSNTSDTKHIKEVLRETWADIDKVAKDGDPCGYKVGIPELDEMGLFQDTNLVIIAGRPGMGKSAFGAQVANSGVPSLIISLEMSNSQLCKRLLAYESKVDLKNIIRGTITDNHYPKLTHATEILAKKDMYFLEADGMSIQDIRSRVRVLQRQHGIKIVIFDYIQLSSDETKSSREQEIASITRNLKQMAKELNLCAVGLSQLNRKLEERTNKRPLMADLRESGAIEQDADVIIFPYRPVVYDKNAPERKAEMDIAKFRNGEPGWCECLFIGEHQRFTSEYKG